MAAPDNPNTFTDNPLDRASLKRLDKDWLNEQLKSPETSIVPLWQLKPLILPPLKEGDFSDIGWVRPDMISDMVTLDPELGPITLFLGLENGRSHFAVDVSHIEAPEQAGPFSGLGTFEELRGMVQNIDPRDASILAQAKSMIDWHRRHGFCAACGSPTVMEEAGYKRQCHNCGAEHFPRTDPVVITAVIREDKCLLGRNINFPGSMFSALAGFLEPGESIEEAVAREVEEEVGLQVGKVHYHSTQPWPYPSSLMIGCLAEALSFNATPDQTEIAEARWFTRDELRDALDGKATDFGIPPYMAIAHQLIRAFVNESW